MHMIELEMILASPVSERERERESEREREREGIMHALSILNGA